MLLFAFIPRVIFVIMLQVPNQSSINTDPHIHLNHFWFHLSAPSRFVKFTTLHIYAMQQYYLANFN